MKIIHNSSAQDSGAEACLFRDNEESMNKGDDFTDLFEDKIAVSRPGGGGGTPIHYLYGYVPPNGVVILKLLI